MSYLQKTVLSTLLFAFSYGLTAQPVVSPSVIIKTGGAVTDLYLEIPRVIVSTDAGTIETYDFHSGKKEGFIILPLMKDFMGDDVPRKVYSVDKLDNNLLVVTQGIHGFRNVLIYKNDQPTKIFDAEKDKFMIKKARWINEKTILLATMSNDLMVWDLAGNKKACELNISPYTFSDFSLTEDRQSVFTCDESGIVHRIAVNDCKAVKTFEGLNVDNIYQLVYKNGMIITAGQDRRVGVYNTLTGNNYFLQQDFLVYSVSLSADGALGAYSADEDNNITVFRTATRETVCVMKGHKSVVTKMEFVDNHTLITAGDDEQLIIWKLK